MPPDADNISILISNKNQKARLDLTLNTQILEPRITTNKLMESEAKVSRKKGFNLF